MKEYTIKYRLFLLLVHGDKDVLYTRNWSLVFVKRMMAIAVSSITYLRGIFPECAYRSRYLEDLCIKVLRENSNTSGANKIVKWMMGCFDALEKQYVSPVYTDPKDRNCIIESYQFNFRYTEKGPEMDIVRWGWVALEDTKRASVLLIRKLFLLLQNLDALPSNVYLTMKLYYYDEITPADYQPPGFQEGVHDRLWFQGVPVHFKVGQVHTTYHSLRVRVSVEQGQVKKLQEGNYLKEPVQVSLRKEAIKVGLDLRLCWSIIHYLLPVIFQSQLFLFRFCFLCCFYIILFREKAMKIFLLRTVGVSV
uniref:Zebrafish testis-expressed 38 n=1 Tax=Poecilia latipinna TaxID=48699 RepID=A0A3B3VKA3_9TELE